VSVSEDDVRRVAEVAARLPPAQGNYLETDVVMNMLATVVDFQMHTTAVVRALGYFREQRWGSVRTLEDLQELFSCYPDDQEGNTRLAQHLWGYNLWTRAKMLRDLVEFFERLGVRDQEDLRAWAAQAEFKRDFEGRVRGLGPAVFQWLVMRQGVDTVKPDVHVHRFVERAIGRRVSDAEAVQLVERAAVAIDVRPHKLDWAIWEQSRSGQP